MAITTTTTTTTLQPKRQERRTWRQAHWGDSGHNNNVGGTTVTAPPEHCHGRRVSTCILCIECTGSRLIILRASSFLAGSIPLSFSLSPRALRMVTALGTGVLVGTSLIVIIPEGVETLYSAGGGAHNPERRTNSAPILLDHHAVYPRAVMHHSWTRDATREGAEEHPIFRTSTEHGFQTAKEAADSQPPSSDPGHEPGVPTQMPPSGPHVEEEEREPHVWIGISLIMGFILMYLVDTLPQHARSSEPQSFQVSLDRFSFNRRSTSNGDPSPPTDLAATESANSSDSRPSSTTIGLVIHAAADGIALGASSTASSSKLSFIIFIALMIHKAPAAFGLTSVLLKQGLSKRMARNHLIVFSLAAPAGAVLTFLAVHLLGYASTLGESSSTEFFTGTLLLFSGGTFLYVAMHTMQETGSALHAHAADHGMNGYAGVPMDDTYPGNAAAAPKPPDRSLMDSLVTVGGMLLPLLTQFGHAH